MSTYLVLFRGINVGGKNTVPMAELRALLEELGFTNVRTYINSGNAFVTTRKGAKTTQQLIEQALPERFALDTAIVKVLAVTAAQLRAVVEARPSGFGDSPGTFHSDVIFLMDGMTVDEALTVFDPRAGVDAVWPGEGVIYSQRLSAERTKSRLGKIVGTAPYQRMTIRSWSTTTKLLDRIDG